MGSKLAPVHVWIIGAVLALMVGGGLWYFLIKPVEEANKSLESQIQGVETAKVSIDGGNFDISQIPAAQAKVKEAKARRIRKQQELDRLQAARRLPRNQSIDVGDGSQKHLLEKTLSKWITLPRYVVRTIGSFASTSAKRFGVEATTAFAAPAPTSDPNTIPKPIISWTLGNMMVTGPWNNVDRWIRNWNKSPLLTSIEGLKYAVINEKGDVSATCAVVVYMFPDGQAATDAAAAGGGAPAGGAGGMGGMGGMMPGMGDAGMGMGTAPGTGDTAGAMPSAPVGAIPAK